MFSTFNFMALFACLFFSAVNSFPGIQNQLQEKDRKITGNSRPERIEVEVTSFPPKPYQFGYELEDGFGMSQYRNEASDGTGVVKGSYGYMDPTGIYRKVEYTADDNGYRAVIRSNEPGTANQNVADALFIVEPTPTGIVRQDIQNEISPRDNKA
ncbi:cuticle protein 10.9-like [Stegodyphus dumicola]|uniref:cuticle protein 10.9-like n=1 Tax=Stegodyphus dumicola TaxID=202533 RepID=UPI0015AB7D82|nr:cuticle protein 10.9-like [Stegodyphus dumicola]